MKKSLQLFSTLLVFVFNTVSAQENTTENTSISSMKETTTEMFRYYFYPNYEAYYDNKTSLYIFKENGKWIQNKEIPTAFRGYSVYNNYKVEITDYNGEIPFLNIVENKKSFPYYSNDRKGKLARLKAKQLADLKKNNSIVNAD